MLSSSGLPCQPLELEIQLWKIHKEKNIKRLKSPIVFLPLPSMKDSKCGSVVPIYVQVGFLHSFITEGPIPQGTPWSLYTPQPHTLAFCQFTEFRFYLVWLQPLPYFLATFYMSLCWWSPKAHHGVYSYSRFQNDGPHWFTSNPQGFGSLCQQVCQDLPKFSVK